MTSLSTRLARAAATGRRIGWKPSSREEVLARLLVKRAEAKQAGLAGLEEALRLQIAWSLPMRGERETAMAAADGHAFHDRL